MTHRTSRIVVGCRSAPLRGSYTLASPTPCFVVSTVAKTIINRFHLGRRLFALRSHSDLGLITAKVMEDKSRRSRQNEKAVHKGLLFILVAEMGFVCPVCFWVVALRLDTLGSSDSQRETSLRQKRLSTVLCLALPFPSPKVMEGKSLRSKRKTHSRKGYVLFLWLRRWDLNLMTFGL